MSLLEQDYPGLEIIVVDGRSTDNTTAVIKSFERHLAHWESVGDEGQADAINKGLARSTGEIFNWLNSDDRLENGALKEIGALAAQHPDKELFIGRARIFQDDETIRMSGRIVFGDDELVRRRVSFGGFRRRTWRYHGLWPWGSIECEEGGDLSFETIA